MLVAFQVSYKASASFDTQLKPVSSSCMKSVASFNTAGLSRENALVQALPLRFLSYGFAAHAPPLPATRPG